MDEAKYWFDKYLAEKEKAFTLQMEVNRLKWLVESLTKQEEAA